MKVYLGADHRGYKLKEEVFQWLVDQGYLVEDYGAYEYEKDDDYTEYAQKVASIVGNHDTEIKREIHQKHGDVLGILLCGSGVGVDIVANKFDGVRASIGKEPEQVRAGREDDDMNVLVIAADFTKESEAKKMIEKFLKTKYNKVARHKRRLQDIDRIEANN